jgi:hypothetical protein
VKLELYCDDPELELVAPVCRASYWAFIEEFWETVPGAGAMIPNWHMKLLAEELQIAAERVFAGQPRLYDIVANEPFGTSKSTVCNILFPPWTWTRMPHARHITATHTDSLARDLASKSRSVILSEKYQRMFPGIKLTKESEGYYTNTMG